MLEVGVFCWLLKLPALNKNISEYQAYLVYFGCTSGGKSKKKLKCLLSTENATICQQRSVNITAKANLETKVYSISPPSAD